MKMKKATLWVVMSGLLLLGACASVDQGTTTTAAAGDGFPRSYKPYVKHADLFTLLKGDYDRLSERQNNYWNFYSAGFSFAQENHIFLGDFISTAPEQIRNVREGYVEDFKITLAEYFQRRGYAVDNDPKGLILEANLWRLDDTPGGRIWIPFNFGQNNAAFGVEMKVVDQSGKLLYAMVYDCTDFSIKKGFNKFLRDFGKYSK
jgi:hypothetical protein